jgi:hypothetical protein
MVHFGERAMKFTVTSGAGVTEVVDRHPSAKAALEHVLVLLGHKRSDVRIFDEDNGLELRRIRAGWQPRRLRCCPMNQA